MVDRYIHKNRIEKAENREIWLQCLAAACSYMQGCQADKNTLIDYANAFYQEAMAK